MEIGILLSIYGGFLAVIAINIMLFLWNRSESNADRRDLSNAIMNLTKEMKDEMKDFHGRLCQIEEMRKR
jgi:hypothetical protein